MLKFKTPIDEMMNNNKLEETKKKNTWKICKNFGIIMSYKSIRNTLRLINWPNYVNKFINVEI